MSTLQHIAEPVALQLTWQPPTTADVARTRRVVGLITPGSRGQSSFQYLFDTPDFDAARAIGFAGYPAFKLTPGEFDTGVDDAFLRRIPSRKREDFSLYLQQHRLPCPFPGSDIALLGYTGARLPGDGFAVVPSFSHAERAPIDLFVEVVGIRHVFSGSIDSITVGTPIVFRVDDANGFDTDAVVVDWQGRPLGYVNRALRHDFGRWLAEREVQGTIDRVSGTSERPVVYARIEVR